jgi:hypothetical protein
MRRGGNEKGAKATYSGLFLLLGLGCFVGTGGSSSVIRFDVAICLGLGLGDFAGYGLGTAPAWTPLGLFLPHFPVLLFSWHGNLDDDLSAIEFLSVEGLDCKLGSLCGGHGDEAIACGADTAQDDLY